MKNVTLSMPEDLLNKARAYAKAHGTTLNEMIRSQLKKTLNTHETNFDKQLKSFQDKLNVDTRVKFDRDSLYER